MDANVIFQILTAFILALFAGVFLAVYLFDRRQKLSGWLSLAYTVGLATILFNVTLYSTSIPMVLTINTLFWASNAFLAIGGCAHAQRPFPLRSFSALVIIGYSSNLYFMVISPDLIIRASFASVIAGSMIALCLPALYANRPRKIDRAFCFCIAAMAAIYILRPFAAFGFLGADYTLVSYSQSTYPILLSATTAITSLATAAAALMAAGLEMAERLQRESVTDHLTGLKNQRGIANFLDENARGETQYGTEGQAVLTFDIDHFKNINDEFGHECGDQVLRKFGQTITQLMQYHGFSGRSGGEEFIFLFSRESSPAAYLIAEHLRVAIGMLHHECLSADQRVTISLGLAFLRKNETTKRAMRRADTALYIAKDEGRNLLKIADGDVMPNPDANSPRPPISSARYS